MSKKIKVNIACKQVICYRQQKEITMQEYNKLKKIGDDYGVVNELGNRAEYSLLQNYLDPADIFDALNEFTDLEVTLSK